MKLIKRLMVLPAIVLFLGLLVLPAGAATPASGSGGVTNSGGSIQPTVPGQASSLTGYCSFRMTWGWSNFSPAGPTSWNLVGISSCQAPATIRETIGLAFGVTLIATCPTATNVNLAAISHCSPVSGGAGIYTVFTHTLVTQNGIGTCYRSGRCQLTFLPGTSGDWAYISANQIRVTNLMNPVVT